MSSELQVQLEEEPSKPGPRWNKNQMQFLLFIFRVECEIFFYVCPSVQHSLVICLSWLSKKKISTLFKFVLNRIIFISGEVLLLQFSRQIGENTA